MDKEMTLVMLLKRKQLTREDLAIRAEHRLPSLNIPYPELKAVASLIYKTDPYAYLNAPYVAVYELEIIETYLIGRIKSIDQALSYFDVFAKRAKEWSTVDALCQKFLIARKHPKRLLPLLKTYANQHDEYLERVVAVTLLSHYFIDDYIDEANALLQTLRHPGYYAQMAVAWAYATMMVRYPKTVIALLENHTFSVWTHNKIIQKSIESFRIDSEMKMYCKTLKRK